MPWSTCSAPKGRWPRSSRAASSGPGTRSRRHSAARASACASPSSRPPTPVRLRFWSECYSSRRGACVPDRHASPPGDSLRNFLSSAAALLVAAFVAQPLFALDPSRALTQYVHDTWSTDVGLPQATVRALLQTRDGYLWIGTEEGLARFDGVRFA